MVVATDQVEKAVAILTEAGFKAERFAGSINLRGRSKVSVQISTEDFYREFPDRALPADVHGILMRVAALEDTLHSAEIRYFYRSAFRLSSACWTALATA